MMLRVSRSWVGFCVSILTGLSAACCFDSEYFRDVHLPATVRIDNRAGSPIELVRFASSAEAEWPFVYGDRRDIAPGAQLDLRVTETTYGTIAAGSFVLEGVCGDVGDWSRAGRSFELEFRSESEFYVTIPIEDCTTER